jgi:hypothetical protein
MPTDLHADAMHISVEELVRRALAVAGDRVMCDGDLIAICADVLYRLSENCQQDGETMMWLNDFSKFKHYIIEHIDLPSGLTVDELARKAVAALGYDFVRAETIPTILSDILAKHASGPDA